MTKAYPKVVPFYFKLYWIPLVFELKDKTVQVLFYYAATYILEPETIRPPLKILYIFEYSVCIADII